MRLRAFTLLELALVIVVIVTLSAMVIPMVGSSNARRRVDTAVQRIIADLAQVQAAARRASASRMVNFSVAENQYRVAGVAQLNNQSGLYIVRLGDDPYRAELVSVDLGGDAAITYDMYGKPDSGGTIVVRVGDWIETIAVDPVSGIAKRFNPIVLGPPFEPDDELKQVDPVQEGGVLPGDDIKALGAGAGAMKINHP